MTIANELKRIKRLMMSMLMISVVPLIGLTMFDVNSIVVVLLSYAVTFASLLGVYRLIKKQRLLELKQFVNQGHIEFEELPDRLLLTLLEPISAKTRTKIHYTARAYASCKRKTLNVSDGKRIDFRAAQEKEIYRRVKRHQIESFCTPTYIDTIDKLHDYYQQYADHHHGRSAFYRRDLRLINDILDDYHSDIDDSVQRQIENTMDGLYHSLDGRYQHLIKQKEDNLLVTNQVLRAEHGHQPISGQAR